MQNKNENKSNTLSSLIGERTPEKASGLAYSLAAVLPAMLSLVFLIVISAAGLTGEGYADKDWYLYASYLLPQISFFLVAVWWLRFSRISARQALKKQKCHPKYFLVAVFLQIGLLCLSELNVWFLELLSAFGYEDAGIKLPSMDGFGLVGVLLAVAVLPAIFEEILFRGVLLNGVRVFGKIGAVVLCGALFALYHQNPAQTVYQFCCGAAFALVALRSGSIFPTVLSHFLNNAAILLMTKFGIDSFSTPVFWCVIAVSAVCLLLSLVYLLFFDKNKNADLKTVEKQEKENEKSGRKEFLFCAAVGIVICAISWLSVFISGL